MILSKDKYIIQKEVIRVWLENKKDKEPLSLISEIAIGTGCPIIIVCQFIGELEGFTPQLELKMKSLMKFYGVDRVQ